MIHWSLRRDRLCEGPHACDEAAEIRDENGWLLRRERCEACPLDKLDRAIGENVVLIRCFDLDFALNAGVRLTLNELDVEEWRALKCLRIERDKYQAEQMKKANRR